MAPATVVHERATDESPAVAVTLGDADGPPLHPESCGVGVEQAIPCRSKALNSAVMWGVPLVRSPSSSSAASHCMYPLAAPHPLEDEPQAQACHRPTLPLPW